MAGETAPKGKPRAVAAPPAVVFQRPTPETLRWLCTKYFASEDFASLDPRTQRVRRGIIEHCLKEPIVPGGDTFFAEVPLDRLTTKAMKVLRDRKAGLPEAANGRVKAFRQVFVWALEEEVTDKLSFNPARDVKYREGRVGGFHHWTVDEVEKYEAAHPIGTSARLGLALLLYTAQRRSDIVQFGRQHVRNGWLRFTQFKGRNRNPVTLEIPIIADFQAIIEASPTGDLTFLTTEFRKPFTSNGFGNRMRKWCNEAGLPHCSAHGLRKASAARLAEVGCTPHEIMSITGHTTMKQIELYTKGARQKRLAKVAIFKLEAAE
ncbi:tyrosine-type recombinase/integrase [Aquabacter sp. CN5-332]|uniref:site-specific integrase n=1 Tax=Aquabacter sp. CN5-332 TaxID=3156608 RepID=UPI0032B486D5